MNGSVEYEMKAYHEPLKTRIPSRSSAAESRLYQRDCNILGQSHLL